MEWQEQDGVYDVVAPMGEWQYRAVVYQAVDGEWRSDTEVWNTKESYFAGRRHADRVMAQLWCEAAVHHLVRVATHLSDGVVAANGLPKIMVEGGLSKP